MNQALYNAAWAKIDPTEREWIDGIEGWQLLGEYHINELTHVVMGKGKNGVHYILRTFILGDPIANPDAQAALSVDFKGSYTSYHDYLFYLLRQNKVRPVVKEEYEEVTA
jgi:hypothetical protein